MLGTFPGWGTRRPSAAGAEQFSADGPRRMQVTGQAFVRCFYGIDDQITGGDASSGAFGGYALSEIV